MASLKRLLEADPPRRIAVLRSDRVGDLILSTPFLTVLRQAYPQAHILGLTAPYCRQVLQWSGLLDAQADFQAGNPWSQPLDLVIALAPRSECLKAARRLRARYRLGYVYRSRPLLRWFAPFLLTHYEVVEVRPPHVVPHEVEQLDRLARRLGLPSTLGQPLTVGLSAPTVPGRLVLHLGDRWLAGGWTLQDLRCLLRGLRELGEVKVTAGPREKQLLAGQSLEVEGVELCLFEDNFHDWAMMLGSAEVVVSPDTGAVHLAAAMRTPVVVAYEASTYGHCSRQWAPWKIPSRSVCKTNPEETIPQLLVAVEELVSDSRNGAP
jgi:ADP-heptose:LPS heptosyltransferase